MITKEIEKIKLMWECEKKKDYEKWKRGGEKNYFAEKYRPLNTYIKPNLNKLGLNNINNFLI